MTLRTIQKIALAFFIASAAACLGLRGSEVPSVVAVAFFGAAAAASAFVVMWASAA